MIDSVLICPKCGSREISRLVYGEPQMDEGLLGDLMARRIKLAGCEYFEGAPIYYCYHCDYSW